MNAQRGAPTATQMGLSAAADPVTPEARLGR